MGRALRLNEDLVEALALFHDIGHPPFGHAGEDALNLCLQNDGGFSHNQYALTIAEELEIRDQPDGGLNLSLEVLEGQATRVDKDAIADPPSLEAQVVEAADSITYDAHDADDAVKLGLVTLDELADLPLVQHCLQRIGTHTSQLNPDVLRRSIVHELIDCQVSNVLRAAEQFLQETPGADWQSPTMKAFRIEPVEQLANKSRNWKNSCATGFITILSYWKLVTQLKNSYKSCTGGTWRLRNCYHLASGNAPSMSDYPAAWVITWLE